MDWVLDSSVALAWALPDETSKHAERFLADLGQEAVLWIPALWWYELANALTMAHQRQRLSESESVQLVELYGSLPIQTDTHLNSDAVWRFHALAKEHSLSAYDAVILNWLSARELDSQHSANCQPAPLVRQAAKSRISNPHYS